MHIVRRITMAGMLAGLMVPALTVPVGAQVREQRQERERQRDTARVLPRRAEAPRVSVFNFEPFMQQNRAAIGVYLAESGAADTAGVLVEDVTEGGPAASAGIEAGDRIVAVNGQDIRLTRSEAADEEQRGLAARRLSRAIGELDPGDAVTLRVRSASGAAREVRLEAVSAAELARVRTQADTTGVRWLTAGRDDRPTIGLSLQSTGSSRDTLGVFVVSVVPDGPAEQAGIFEGDRIVSIGDTDLRVRPVDAGDPYVAELKVEALSEAVREAEVGEAVTLRVWRAGEVRTVRVTPAPASEVRSEAGPMQFFRTPMPPGGMRMRSAPRAPRAPRVMTIPPGTMRMTPGEDGVRIFRFDGDSAEVIIDIDPEARVELREHMEEAMREMRRSLESLQLRQGDLQNRVRVLSPRVSRRIV